MSRQPRSLKVSLFFVPLRAEPAKAHQNKTLLLKRERANPETNEQGVGGKTA
jgi:hypothetical protein